MGKYDNVAPEAVKRAYRDAALRYAKAKDAEKAARDTLHQMTDAFMSTEAIKRARKLAAAYEKGDTSALEETLKLHASTRERLSGAEEFYQRVYGVCGDGLTLDLACGLNPILLGSLGHETLGIEAHGGQAEIVNLWGKMGLPIRAEVGDLVTMEEYPAARTALMLKLLPVLERQEKGASARLIERLKTDFAVISFPTRTLGGRSVGMAEQYARWFESEIGTKHVRDRFETGLEMVYILDMR